MNTSKHLHRLVACLGTAASLLCPGLAAAQSATALDRYDPAPAGDPFLGAPSPGIDGRLRPSFGALLSYAQDPLVLVTNDGERDEVASVVDHQVLMHLMGSLELFHRAKVYVSVPMVLSQGGDSPVFDGVTYGSPSGFSMADIRAGMRFEVLKQADLWPAIALSFNAWFPSGNDDAYAGAGVVRYQPQVNIGADYGDFVWTANVGRRFQAEVDGNLASLLGSELDFSAGIGGRVGPILLSAEVLGSTVMEGRVDPFQRATSNVEAHVGVAGQIGPIMLRGIGGPGLTPGVGTPDFRFVAYVGYQPTVPKVVAKKDLYTVPNSAVEIPVSNPTAGPAGGVGRLVAVPPPPSPTPRPAVPGSTKPAPGTDLQPPSKPVASATVDTDNDGIVDAKDKCPRKPGVAANRGCPPDKDGDGVSDAEDACPTVKGLRSSDPKTDGCPGDDDNDGILNPDDRCPGLAGEANTTEPKFNGCPKSVRLSGKQIVILQKVEFAVGRAEISSGSEGLLKQVADVMNAHPDIVRIAVDGHTDNTGNAKRNVALSQARAVAVVRWLVANGGVDSRRLEARGFGPKRPVADNGDKAGRSKNRRVEFQILKRDRRGKLAWTDGPVE